MADGGRVQARLVPQKPAGLQNRLMSSSRFRGLAERIPGIRRLVKRDGAALFDVMAGFCHSQILMALAELRIPDALMGGPQTVSTLAAECQMPERRMDILVQAGASIGILKRTRGKVSLTRKGAAFASVPGLSAMVRHHRAFYRDLQDPVAFFRGEVETELAEVWPYVFDASGHIDPSTASAYSDLMAQSQHLVAADTLRMVDFSKTTTLLDIGGGTGAFLEAAGAAHPHLSLHLFDLPTVALDARARFDAAGFGDRARISTGSFRTDQLPQGADAISLVRVLYDHSDQTVASLLSSVFDALPPGGRLIVSEPMSGGDHPDKATDGYFALYTMAMRTGETRSPDKIGAMVSHAGFEQVKIPRAFRNYVTSVVTAVKPI